MDVIVLNDPAHLAFSGLIEVPGLWLMDGMPMNAPENINASVTDGNMLYTAWANFGGPTYATPAGLLATTFRFVAEAPAVQTELTIPRTFGESVRTAVYDGTVPNLDVTGQLGTARIMIVPQNVPIAASVVQAKAMPDGTDLAISGPIVTRRFDTFFYLEDADRVSGIRVNYDGGPALQGTRPAVRGTLRTIDGERVIDDAAVCEGPAAAIPAPFAMNLSAAAAGLSPQGLLVRLTGSSDGEAGSASFLLSDGSPEPIRVDLQGFTLPAGRPFVIVTGTLGRDAAGHVLHVNSPNDLQILPQ